LSFAKAPLSFREHIDAALRSTSPKIGELYPFLEFGRYSEQVQRYYDQFPSDRVRVFFYEDYQRDPLALLRSIFRFLAVDESFVPDLRQRHMEARVPRSFAVHQFLRQSGIQRSAGLLIPRGLHRVLRPVVYRRRQSMTLGPADRARLADFYRADIDKLAALLRKDLSSWLDPL
jgi:hypothetical protein